ncbi:hypothetical protein, partial [Adlercreutzia sp. ZJ138]|uniref:DUF6998 domain-containing protein n=1 Tax=Adlercreutzia sp. ZJ138 TaxID=2709405 RepID=UPI00197CBFD5
DRYRGMPTGHVEVNCSLLFLLGVMVIHGHLLVSDVQVFVHTPLEEMYPGRHFTPDGHMVGSLGEAITSEWYGLRLFKAAYPIHDGVAPDGRLVQVKATQGNKIGINEKPDYLIVLKMHRDGTFEEIYNGPGEPAWDAAGEALKTGQRPLSLTKLRGLNSEVLPEQRIPTLD